MSNEDWKDLVTMREVAEAQHTGWEIDFKARTYWEPWDGELWVKHNTYRGRPKQVAPAMVIPCYFTGNGLTWSLVSMPEWVRVPELDKTIMVTK